MLSTQKTERTDHHRNRVQILTMRNLALFLLFMSLFAANLSRDIYKRYANQYEDGPLLEAFLRAVDEGKIDISNLVQDKREDIKKRCGG
ncbi:hypothetical protein CHS0354_017044 [Potamilus streckersoni]|uniref:Uncharacterized protein n=1 Tax=Potamilus streckersoni TaxID=2493646 RepID=A0AAE0W439_9BIVA|nr:hypothetical protein CHS0354_017044 [Potamilus streckersoni]